jgi:MFS family permease
VADTEAIAAGLEHAAAARPRASLGRSFRRLWFGNSASALGDGMWFAALPLLAASLSRDPRVVSSLEAAAGLPWLLFGLHAGALADRWDRRTLMWRGDLVRLGIVGLMAALIATAPMKVPLLLLLVFVLATVGTLVSTAAPALLPSVVPEQLLARANARLTGTSTIGRSLFGPVLGSLIFGVAPWAPFLADALSFGAAAWSTQGLPRATGVDNRPKRPINREMIDGLRWTLRTVQVRALAIAAVLLSMGTGAFLGCFVLFVLGPLNLPAAAYGFLMATYAVGAIGGSMITTRTTHRIGLPWTCTAAAMLGAVAFLVIGLVPIWPVTALMVGALGLATMVWNIATVTLRQKLTPNRLLGRVSSVFGMIAMGSAAVGAPTGGAVASSFGLPAAIICAGALCAVGAVTVALFLPTSRTAAAPTAADVIPTEAPSTAARLER